MIGTKYREPTNVRYIVLNRTDLESSVVYNKSGKIVEEFIPIING